MSKYLEFSVSMPQSWSELSEAQLVYVYFLMSEGYAPMAIRMFCFMRWSGIKVLANQGRSHILVEKDGKKGFLSAAQVTAAAEVLSFLDNIPQTPVRLDVIDGHEALPADFMGVPFEKYIVVDNLYQGYLHTKDEELLKQMAQVLYAAPNIQMTAAEKISVFYWMASLKLMLRVRFSHFFQPINTAQDGNMLGASMDISRQLQESMDAQIRALTKGDVTKEAEVLLLDTWRVLTELNAQAKEYEELRRNSK